MITATVVTDLKANLKHYIEKAVSGDSIIITRPKKANAVLIIEIYSCKGLTVTDNILPLV